MGLTKRCLSIQTSIPNPTHNNQTRTSKATTPRTPPSYSAFSRRFLPLPAASAAVTTLHRFRLQDFTIGRCLGRGSQASVKKVLHNGSSNHTPFALKIFELSDGSCSNALASQDDKLEYDYEARLRLVPGLLQELLRLKAAPHPHVVSYHGLFFAEHRAMILMDYMNLGSLANLLHHFGPIPTPILSFLMAQVTCGLAYLHDSCRLIHCDLKPSNLLLDSSTHEGGPLTVKISDFGVSVYATSVDEDGESSPLDPADPIPTSLSSVSSQAGSTLYMSPERMRGEPFGFAADIWSLGLTCAECAVGMFPLMAGPANEPEGLLACEYVQNPAVAAEDPLNVFDISTMVAANEAVVQWDILASLRLCVPPFPESPTNPSCSPTDSPTFNNWPICESCKEFVERCLHHVGSHRPTANELLNTHPFVAEAPFGLTAHSEDASVGRWLENVFTKK